MEIPESDKRLKQMPFNVPDGYFAKLQQQVMESAADTGYRAGISTHKTLSYRLLQISTAAAMLAAVVTGSITLIQDKSDMHQDELMLDDSFFYTELMPQDTDILYDSDSYGYIADTGLSDEDIIDFLICSGTPVELLNDFDYE